MIKTILRYLLIGIIYLNITPTFAQIEHPVSWEITLQHIDKNNYEVRYAATIQAHWHLYSYDIGSGGPVPTTITFKPNDGISIIGNPITSKKPTEKMDPMFDMKIRYFDSEVSFSQKIKISTSVTKITGYVEYMSCNDEKCLQPEQEKFDFPIVASSKEQTIIPAVQPSKSINQNLLKDSIIKEQQTNVKRDSIIKDEIKAIQTNISTPAKASYGLWLIFITGFLGGFLALLTPCVFPMIPLTVSFFIKRKKKHLSNAMLYGLSIIVIYVGLGFITSLVFGPDAMNA